MVTSQSFKMGWRYVTYREGEKAVSFTIEPMFSGKDFVYFPSEARWFNVAPDWIKNNRSKILDYLKSIVWNRELFWQNLDNASCREINHDKENIVPGSLESTPGGKFLEDKRFFHPDSDITFEQARQLWIEADKKFTQQARGRVIIDCDSLVPNSIFEKIELPILKENPNVLLNFKNKKIEASDNQSILESKLKNFSNNFLLHKIYEKVKLIFKV